MKHFIADTKTILLYFIICYGSILQYLYMISVYGIIKNYFVHPIRALVACGVWMFVMQTDWMHILIYLYLWMLGILV